MIYKILVEIVELYFFVEIEYEKLLDFYNYFSDIGHSFRVCRRRALNTMDKFKSKAKGKVQKVLAPMTNKQNEPCIEVANLILKNHTLNADEIIGIVKEGVHVLDKMHVPYGVIHVD